MLRIWMWMIQSIKNPFATLALCSLKFFKTERISPTAAQTASPPPPILSCTAFQSCPPLPHNSGLHSSRQHELLECVHTVVPTITCAQKPKPKATTSVHRNCSHCLEKNKWLLESSLCNLCSWQSGRDLWVRPRNISVCSSVDGPAVTSHVAVHLSYRSQQERCHRQRQPSHQLHFCSIIPF